MASKLRARTRGKPTHAKARAAQSAGNVKRAQKAKKAQVDRRAAYNQDRARSGQLKNKRGNIATGGESTARESGIIASQKAKKSTVNKIKGIEQSVGSLDRRIQTALDKGDTGTAKDLRSRLNKFTNKLGYERAILHDGVMRNKDGKILRSTSGNPMMNTRGRKYFDETKDQDFIDPTRKLKNTDIAAFREMYPNPLIKGARGLADLYEKFSPMANIAKAWNKAKGLPVVNELGTMGRDLKNVGKETKNALMKNINLPKIEFRKRNVPYNLDDMPGVRYPLDEGWGRGEGATPFGGRSRDPNYKQPFFSWPDTDVSISDLIDPVQLEKNRILESQGIDENFIYPGQDGEPGNTALQLAYDDSVQEALAKNVELDKFGEPFDQAAVNELLKNLATNTDSKGRYTGKLANPFFLDEQQKIKLREEADQNKRVLSDQEKQILDDKGISEHYLDMYPDTNLTEQSLSDMTNAAGIGSTNDTVNAILAGINRSQQDGYDVAELTEDQMNLMLPGINQPDLPGGLNKEQLWNKDARLAVIEEQVKQINTKLD